MCSSLKQYRLVWIRPETTVETGLGFTLYACCIGGEGRWTALRNSPFGATQPCGFYLVKDIFESKLKTLMPPPKPSRKSTGSWLVNGIQTETRIGRIPTSVFFRCNFGGAPKLGILSVLDFFLDVKLEKNRKIVLFWIFFRCNFESLIFSFF